MWAKVKLAIAVVILSGLVWIFAERAQIQNTTITVDLVLVESRSDLFVQFLDQSGDILVSDGTPGQQRHLSMRLTVQGPAGRIQQVRPDQNSITPVILLDVQNFKGLEISPDVQEYSFNIIEYLNERRWFDKDYLQVIEVEPMEVIRIRSTRRVERQLPVVVRSELGAEFSQAVVDPQIITAHILPEQPLEASVILTEEQRREAAQQAISVVARITAPGVPEKVNVTVRLPETTAIWPEDEIKTPNLGIIMPLSMVGKYQVEVEDIQALLDEYSPVRFQGAAEAVNEYRSQRYHLLLEIDEKDRDQVDPPPSRRLSYNLPPGTANIKIINPVTTAARFHVQKTGPLSGKRASDTYEELKLFGVNVR